MQIMKAVVLDENKVLRIEEVEKPQPKENEVLVKIHAAALNHREIWISKGMYPGMSLPSILGADGAGTIVETGKNVDIKYLNKEVIIYPALNWGDKEHTADRSFRVLGMPDSGTLAEYISVPLKYISLKPKYLSWEEAAAIPIAGLTAYRGLFYHGQLKKGSTVLITGIGGGVAQAALALAVAKKAKVFVTSSSLTKISDAVSKGAISGVNYKEKDWNVNLKEISQGIDIVLDSSPSSNLDEYLKFMNYGGKIIAYGSTASRNTTLNISKFFLRHIHFIGTTMGSPTQFEKLLQYMSKYEIRPTIDNVYSIDKSTDAFIALGQGKHIGKIVIKIV